jgi:hypothetical protein
MALEPNCQHAEYLRCSRPLCSSQNTGGTHCAWPKPVTQESVDRDIHRMSEVQRSVLPFGRSGPSGPNSVQKTRLSAGNSSIPASGKYWDARFDPGHNVNVPPMSVAEKQMLSIRLGRLFSV